MWKTIKRVGNPYQVNEKGQIRNVNTGVILKVTDSSGYLGVTVKPDGRYGKSIRLRVHRCVAEEFLDGYFEGAVVNHKDGDKHNNVLENLEWVTNAENALHAVRTGLLKVKGKFDSPLSKITREQVQYIKENINNKSIRSMAREIGISHTAVLKALKW